MAELRVGLLVLGGIAVLILALFTATGDISLFNRKTTIKTRMGNVDGLRKGGEVRLSGVRVGSIKDINFNPQIPGSEADANLVEIIMEVSGKINGLPVTERIRTDSRAVLKSAGVLGDYVVDITPGTTKGKPIQNGAEIQSIQQKGVGDIINAAQTAVANFNDISDDIKTLTGRIKEGKGNVGKLINEDTLYNDLNRAVLQANELVASLRRGNGTAAKFINDPGLYDRATETISQLKETVGRIDEQLNAGKGTIGKLLKDEELYNRANGVIARVDQASARLDSLIAKVERGEGNLGKLFNDEKVYEDTRVTLDNLKAIAARLERGEGTVGRLLKDESLYSSVNSASAEITKLLYDFRQNPKKYLSVKVTIF
ncbi:MAG TPA: MlaD family protein [Blastocatellia bacterium]|nr:MlaD family protein [Blastocatellia bacterium]